MEVPTEINLPSPHAAANPNTRHCLVYFIPGNPGLIDYYVPFLTHLRGHLDAIEAAHAHTTTFHLHGRTLAGFDPADHRVPFNTTTNRPLGVEAQITSVLHNLRATAATRPFDHVVLIGHSLGTYIALEIFHRLQQLKLQDPASPDLNLTAGILLFATIAHLARSPSGKRLDLLRRVPVLRDHAHTLARALLALVPARLVRWVLAAAMGMAPHAVDATARFLASADAVHQALYLGMDEMAVIADERWADELWEVAGAHDGGGGGGDVPPKFFIFFGKEDRWVANEYRDRFIAAREEHAGRQGPQRGRTKIVVDEGNLPHDFCINHSETVAEKVKVWINELAERP